MNGHILAGTDIAVDYWKIQGMGGRFFHFLTHLHGDHISGLTSSWHRPIYCSEFTSRLLTIKHGLASSLLKICALNESMLVSGNGCSSFTVTAYDANHCPGAVMFYFQGDFGNILYTGDFRASPDLVDRCRHLAGHIDNLYLDNTFCSPKCIFPSREECLDLMVSVVEQHKSHHVLIGVRKLGKEMLLAQLGLRLNETVGVSPACYHVSQMLFATDIFTITSPDSKPRIQTVPMHTISRRYVDQLNTTQPTIAVIPSAVFTGLDFQPFCRDTNIFVVPYSDHSSYAELLEFVSMLRPARVLPIVKQLRGPFGMDISDRADMSCFQGILLKSGRHILNNSMCDRQLRERCTESNKERMFLRETFAQANLTPTHFSQWSVCKRDQISPGCKKSRFKSGVRGRKRPATGVVYVNFSADGQELDYSHISHPSQQLAHMTSSGTTSHPTQKHSYTAGSDITSQQLQETLYSEQHRDILQLHSERTAPQDVDSHHEYAIVDSAASHPSSLCDCPLPDGCRKCLEENVCAYVVARCYDSNVVARCYDSNVVARYDDADVVARCHDSYVVARCNDSNVVARCDDAYVVARCDDANVVARCDDANVVARCDDADVVARCDDSNVVARCDDSDDGVCVDEHTGSLKMVRHNLFTQQSLADDSQVDNFSSNNPDSPISFKSYLALAGQCYSLTDQQHGHSLISTLSDLTDQQHGHSLTSTLSDYLPQGRSVSSQIGGSPLLKYTMKEQGVGGGSRGLKSHIGVDHNLVHDDCTQCDNIHLELVSSHGVLETFIREVDNRSSDSCILQKCALGGSHQASLCGQCASITESSAASGSNHPGQELDISGGCPELKLPLDSQDELGVESTSFMPKFLPTAAITSKSLPTAAITSKSSPTATIQHEAGGTGLTCNHVSSTGLLRRKRQIFELKRHEIGHFIASLQEFLKKT